MQRVWWMVQALLLCSFIPPSAAMAGVTLHPGIKAGVNVANFRGDFAVRRDTKIRLGVDAGASAVIDFGGPVSGETGIYYTQRGAKIVSYGADASGNVVSKINSFFELYYVEIPVLVRVRLGNQPVAPYVVGGPAIAMKTRARFTTKVSGPSVDLPTAKNTDISLVAGAGVTLPEGPWTLGIEARYTAGMTEVFDVVGDGPTARHSVFAVLLSVSV